MVTYHQPGERATGGRRALKFVGGLAVVALGVAVVVFGARYVTGRRIGIDLRLPTAVRRYVVPRPEHRRRYAREREMPEEAPEVNERPVEPQPYTDVYEMHREVEGM